MERTRNGAAMGPAAVPRPDEAAKAFFPIKASRGKAKRGGRIVPDGQRVPDPTPEAGAARGGGNSPGSPGASTWKRRTGSGSP